MPHSTTGCSPAKLFLQQDVRTRLSLVKPDTGSVVSSSQSRMKSYHDQHARCREFDNGQPVLAQNYRSNDKWQPTIVLERKGPHSYVIVLPDGRLWNRHVDQLLQDSPSVPQVSSERPEPIPANLGSTTDTPVLPTPSTCTSSTESTAPVVTQPKSTDGSPKAQDTPPSLSTMVKSPIKLRRLSRTLKPPKSLIGTNLDI